MTAHKYVQRLPHVSVLHVAYVWIETALSSAKVKETWPELLILVVPPIKVYFFKFYHEIMKTC